MTGAGGFTGAGSIPAIDRPMLVPAPGVNIPKKKKDRKTVVREAAFELVQQLLDDETDAKTPGTGDGIGRHA